MKNLVRAIASGYLALAANVLYTMASVPLALHYLSKEEFGLWAVTAQLAGYLALIDFGMSPAVGRILIDHKDDKEASVYGSTVQTGLYVNLVQALIIILVGGGLAWITGPLVGVPAPLLTEFKWLMAGQCVVVGAGFALRVLGMILTAHQRQDLANYIQAMQFVLSFGLLAGLFYSGRGIYSAVWAQLIALIPVGIAYYIACRHFKLLPRPGKWGKPTVKVFREIFAFGFDMFLFVLGLQLVNASQTVLITRVLGLEAGAVWSVGTRVFSLLGQIIGRIFDFAAPALAEMIVRGERGRLLERFRSLATLSLSLGIFAGSGYALCNRAFVSVWTSGRMQWAAENDLLLAFWLCLQLLTRVHVGLIGQSKEFRFLRYIYFFEGIFFIGGGLLSLKGGGISLMILVSIVGTMLFSLPYSLWRTAEYFGISWKTVTSGWCRPSFVFAACLLPVAVVLAWVARFWSPQFQLAVLPVTCGVIGITFLIRVGLDPLLRDEICRRAPTVFRPLIHVLAGVPAATADRH